MPILKSNFRFKMVAPALIFAGCLAQASPVNYHSQEFKKKWFQGLAEINRFELTQARYGQLRAGEAVLVFRLKEWQEQRERREGTMSTMS